MGTGSRLVWLFGVNFAISAFTFGGGYVVIPMIRRTYVDGKKLFPESELMDMAAIAQSSPGAIAVNLAMLAGYRVAGLAGAVISCLGAIAPPLVILAIVSIIYQSFRDERLVAAAFKGMEAGVAALIVDLVIDMCRAVFRKKHFLSTILVPAAFVASFALQINVALILIACVFVAVVEGVLSSKEGRDHADDMGTAA